DYADTPPPPSINCVPAKISTGQSAALNTKTARPRLAQSPQSLCPDYVKTVNRSSFTSFVSMQLTQLGVNLSPPGLVILKRQSLLLVLSLVVSIAHGQHLRSIVRQKRLLEKVKGQHSHNSLVKIVGY